MLALADLECQWTRSPFSGHQYTLPFRGLINFRLRKGGIAPEGDLLAHSLLALDLGQQQLVPVVSAVHVAGTQLRR